MDRRELTVSVPGPRSAEEVSLGLGISLELLDGFRLTVGDEVVDVADSTQRLVALLALRERPLCRSLVAGTLWPEKLDARASANLRSSLWRLNGACEAPMIVCTGSSLMLSPEVSRDVAELERQGWALVNGDTEAVTDQVCDWFSKELLPGWYDDWVIIQRERFAQLQIHFLEALVHRLRELGEFARAIDQAMRLVAIDPFRERSQLAFIQALIDEGSWGRAQRQADQYCRLLEDSFGRSASDAFLAAYRALVPFVPTVSLGESSARWLSLSKPLSAG
jgi:DNA-binding SARP family transcriptional activator